MSNEQKEDLQGGGDKTFPHAPSGLWSRINDRGRYIWYP